MHTPIQLLNEVEHSPVLNGRTTSPNKIKIPKVKLRFVEEDIEKFNTVYQWIISTGFQRVDPTPSGGIPVSNRTRYFPFYMVHVTNHSVELVISCSLGQFRFIIGAARDDKTGITGSYAYNTFVNTCRKFGIDITTLGITNGKEVKKTIPSPRVELSRIAQLAKLTGQGKNIANCHHMDINSAFMAAIAQNYPVLEKPIQYIYDERKRTGNAVYKAILTHAYGYFQSQWCRLNGHGYALAHLSKAAIETTNAQLDFLTKLLEENGRHVLLYNTDGLWYEGELFDCINQTTLGGVKHDYINCTLNIKSKGAYQFEGFDTKKQEKVFKAVFRGISSYEKIKPREEWAWDDIYKATAITYNFDENRGIVENDDDERLI